MAVLHWDLSQIGIQFLWNACDKARPPQLIVAPQRRDNAYSAESTTSVAPWLSMSPASSRCWRN